jgi:hypothetical protein
VGTGAAVVTRVAVVATTAPCLGGGCFARKTGQPGLLCVGAPHSRHTCAYGHEPRGWSQPRREL